MLLFSPFLFPPKKKREEEKENEFAKIVIKSHVFQTGHKKICITSFLRAFYKLDTALTQPTLLGCGGHKPKIKYIS